MPSRSRPLPTTAALPLVAVLAGVIACAVAVAMASSTPAGRGAEGPMPMNSIAESYVKLALAVGQHDANYVDAFYGPAEWKQAAEAAGKRPLPDLLAEARRLLAALAALPASPEPEPAQGPAPPSPATPAVAAAPARGGTSSAAGPDTGDSADELPRLRRRYLERQLSALAAHVWALGGLRRTFDEESRSRFVIPPDRVDGVFAAAIAECRRRTAAHVALPPGESFTVAYVKDKPWSGYNWYQGGFRSLIQVNTDLPIYIDRALDLAGHEGYPGHHVYNALLEQHLVRDRGWVELTVYPLFSPQSLIAEGTANFGVEVVFPGPERVIFERQVLYPLAGLDPGDAARYDRLQELLRDLGYAGNEAARGWLDGKLTRDAAQAWLERYALMSPERAAQRLRFLETYRSYVINYNYGQDLVRRYIEARGGTADHPEQRWREFARLISSPRLPSDLR